jgi:hypothetical protein
VGTRAVTAILLGTNVLLSLVSAPDRVAPNALNKLADQANALYAAGQLNWSHKDPFDRMIVTQAARRSLTIANERHTTDRRGAHTGDRHSGRTPLMSRAAHVTVEAYACRALVRG